jgi:hypothetical protein
MTREYVINRRCVVCGVPITVVLNESGQVLSEHAYFGKMRLGVGNWAYAELDEDGNFRKCIPWYREFMFRLIDAVKTVLHLYRNVELWECQICSNAVAHPP